MGDQVQLAFLGEVRERFDRLGFGLGSKLGVRVPGSGRPCIRVSTPRACGGREGHALCRKRGAKLRGGVESSADDWDAAHVRRQDPCIDIRTHMLCSRMRRRAFGEIVGADKVNVVREVATPFPLVPIQAVRELFQP